MLKGGGDADQTMSQSFFVKLFLFLSYLVCLLEFIVSGCDTWWIFIIPTLSPASFLRRLPLNSLSLPHHYHHHPSPSPPPLPHPNYVMMTRLMISKVIAEWDKVWSRLSSHLQPFFWLIARILTIFAKKCRILTRRNKRESYSIVFQQNNV